MVYDLAFFCKISSNINSWLLLVYYSVANSIIHQHLSYLMSLIYWLKHCLANPEASLQSKWCYNWRNWLKSKLFDKSKTFGFSINNFCILFIATVYRLSCWKCIFSFFVCKSSLDTQSIWFKRYKYKLKYLRFANKNIAW